MVGTALTSPLCPRTGPGGFSLPPHWYPASALPGSHPTRGIMHQACPPHSSPLCASVSSLFLCSLPHPPPPREVLPVRQSPPHPRGHSFLTALPAAGALPFPSPAPTSIIGSSACMVCGGVCVQSLGLFLAKGDVLKVHFLGENSPFPRLPWWSSG